MLSVKIGEKKDYRKIKEFIIRSEAVFEESSLFITVENEQKELMAVMGIQMFDQLGLLRSFVFTLSFPTEKLPIFLEKALVVASENGCEKLYLATNKEKSVPFFEAFGFSDLEDIQLENERLSTTLKQFSQKENVFFMWKTL